MGIAKSAHAAPQYKPDPLFAVNGNLPGVKMHLDAVSKERNTVMHEKRSGAELEVHGFRDRLLRVCRAWMETDVRPGA